MKYPAQRNSDLAKIHIAKKQLCLDDDLYRDVLWTVGRVRSAAELDAKGRRDLIAHFKSRGWKNNYSRRQGDDPKARKILSLWLSLRDVGALRNASDQALDRYVQRLCKVDAVRFLTAAQKSFVIETMKKWLGRYDNDD